MALTKRQSALVKEIAKRYGSVIDLKKTPGVLVEILRSQGAKVEDDEGCAGGGRPGSIAVAAGPPKPPPPSPSETGDLGLADVMRAILKLQRDVNKILKELSQKAAKGRK